MHILLDCVYTNRMGVRLCILDPAGTLAKYIVIVKDVLTFILLSYLPFKKQISILFRIEFTECFYVEQCVISFRSLCSVTESHHLLLKGVVLFNVIKRHKTAQL